MGGLGNGAVLRAGLGGRRVVPGDTGAVRVLLPARTTLTAQLGLGLRPGRYTAVSVSYARTPFDETTALMRTSLTLDAVDLNIDVSPGGGWSLSGGANATWLSDGNRRLAPVAAGLCPRHPCLQVRPL